MSKSCASSLWRRMWRTKSYTNEELQSSELKRCLSPLELTLYGVGQTIGTGTYVLSGAVVRHLAGPAAPISYLLGGLISLMSALCYAEFSTIIPRAGSSYSYTYFTIGQWVAYVIGWDLMLEHSMIAAGTSRALVSSLDLLLDNSIKNWTQANIGTIDIDGMTDTPQFVSALVVLVVAGVVMLGAKQSVVTTAFLASVNLIIALVIIVCGLRHANIDNWTNESHGGYLPFGVGGIMSGTSIVFAAYSGYDAICTAAEETEDPAKNMPVAITATMLISMTVYILISSTLTLASPYYLVDADAAFTELFKSLHEPWPANVVTAAIMIAAVAVLLCNMFAVSRIAFAMARDGVLFKCFRYVYKRTQTPIWSVLIFALATAVISILFDVEQVAEVISVGTLMAATIVPLSVLVLRYRPHMDEATGAPYGGQLKPFVRSETLLKMDARLTVKVLITVMALCMTVTSVLIRAVTLWKIGRPGDVVCLTAAFIMALVVVMCNLLLCCFEQNRTQCSFRIPLVPWFPSLSVYLSVICLGQISDLGWIRYSAWMLVGTVIYFGYGIWHADPSADHSDEKKLLDHPSTADYQSNSDQ